MTQQLRLSSGHSPSPLTSLSCIVLLTLWLLAPTLTAAWFKLHHDGWGHGALALLFAVAVFVAPLVLLGGARWLFWFWLPVGLLAPLQTYLIYFFRSVPGDALTQSMLRTSTRELTELIDGLGWLPYALPLTWLVYLALLRGVSKSAVLKREQRKGLLALLLIYLMLGMFRDAREGEATFLPELVDMRTMRATYPASAIISLKRTIEANQDQAALALRRWNASAPPTPQLVILVIGETLRPDHLSLNGYGRETTPELGKIADQLLSFTNVSSTANYTARAVHNLVSQPRQDGIATLVGAFREAGYTTAWLSNQDSGVILPRAHIEYFSETSWQSGVRYDSVLLPELAACLRQCGARQFIVLHLLGSHFPYDKRYPSGRGPFYPTYAGVVKKSITLANKQELINSYDNSILETDRFLAEVIGQANRSDKPAIVLFTADHGENLYDDERKLVLHSGDNPSRADTFVPLLVWANPAYRLTHPDNLVRLAARRDAPISHLDIMPTLLDLAQVDYDGKRGERSFASPAFLPSKRFVQTDKDKISTVDSLR